MPNLIGGIVLGYTWQIIINSILSEYGATLVSDWKYGYLGLIVLINGQLIGLSLIRISRVNHVLYDKHISAGQVGVLSLIHI